ncbi:MAG: hypothetical protein KKC20_24695, partial [Proteobacteria bacterium]|nr:hypothetical protein [Pseudomonadota bacterium]
MTVVQVIEQTPQQVAVYVPGPQGEQGIPGLPVSVNEIEQVDGNITITTDNINDTETNRFVSDTQISSWDAKQAAITGAATSILSSDLTASKALVSDVNGKVAVSAVSAAELGYLSNLTTNVQTFINLKGAVSGLAELDANGKVPTAQLPALAITETFVVASEVAQLALTAQEGDVAIRTDLSKSYIQNGGSVGDMTDWSELLTPTDTVLSVFGRTGAVAAVANDYTWAQIDKTTSSLADITTRPHSGLTNLTNDDHTQYALLAGRSGGQVIYGGTGASENLELLSTSHSVKGAVILRGRLSVLNTGNSVFIGEGAGAVDDYNYRDNIAIGKYSLFVNVNTGGIVSIGVSAANSITTGTNSIFIGKAAGIQNRVGSSLTNVTDSILIGSGARSNANGESNQIVIGRSAIGNGSNTATLGNTSVTDVYLGEAGSAIARGSRFISNVATGTAPYSATSTTLNANLNADLL